MNAVIKNLALSSHNSGFPTANNLLTLFGNGLHCRHWTYCHVGYVTDITSGDGSYSFFDNVAGLINPGDTIHVSVVNSDKPASITATAHLTIRVTERFVDSNGPHLRTEWTFDTVNIPDELLEPDDRDLREMR